MIYPDEAIEKAIEQEWSAFEDWQIAIGMVSYMKETMSNFGIDDEEAHLNLNAAEKEEVETWNTWIAAKNKVDYMIFRNQIAILTA